MSALWLGVACFFLALLIFAGFNFDQYECSFPSPGGKAGVEVIQYGALMDFDARIRIEVRTPGGGSITLYNGIDQDAILGFAAAGWTPDSRKVGVFALNVHALDPIVVGLDLASMESLPRQEALTLAREAVRREYQLPESVGDPVEWARSSEASRAFSPRKRYVLWGGNNCK